MFDQYLALTEGQPAVQAAVSLGVDDTYISKLRTGWRPSRVREDLWQRLVAVLSSAARQAVREPAVGYRGESREYYRGKQDTLMDIMRWVVDQQSQIGAYLRHREGEAITPTVDEAEAAEAILDRLPPPQKAPAQQRKKRA